MSGRIRVALAYVHMEQSYVGGLLRRAARRLNLDVVTVGPDGGRWIENAPVEDDWRPDVVTSRAPQVLPVDCDVLINVDQGDGFYCTAPRGLPVAHVFTEGNEGEYARATASGAREVWSTQPFKIVPRPVDVRWLEWGYDPEHTPVTYYEPGRPLDFVLLASTGVPRRQRLDHVLAGDPSLACRIGPPISRAEWGAVMRTARTTLQDHPVPALPGRVVDAVVSGCLVISVPNPVMDIFLPRGYADVRSPEPEDVRQVVRLTAHDHGRWADIRARALDMVRGLTWDNQLLRVLGSVGIRA